LKLADTGGQFECNPSLSSPGVPNLIVFQWLEPSPWLRTL
jgi:hypothetical protein